MRPNKIAQPPRPQQRTNSRDGRLNFAQQAEMNLRPEPKILEKPAPRSNSYNRIDRPVSQEEVRSALTLLKAKRERERMQTQIVYKPDPEFYQAPPLKKTQSQQPYSQQPQTYEEIVAKEDKKPMQLNEYEDEFEEMVECPEGCGRKFKESALEKHVRVCKKVFQQKRKAFDTKEQRIINDDHAKLLLQKQNEEQQQRKTHDIVEKQQSQKKPKGDDRQIQGQKKPKWKVLSEQFRAALKQNKGAVLSHEEQVIHSNKQVALQEEDDRVQCDYCGRKFNEKAAEKHIPSCKEKAKINQMKKQSSMPPPIPMKQQPQLNGTNSFPKQNQQKNLNGTNNAFNSTSTSTKRPPPPVQKKY